VVGEEHNAQVLVSLSAEAEAAGLRTGQPLRDARAMCPDLDTRLRNRDLDAAFLAVLRRWAGKFSPWVSEQPPDGLVIDLTGCAHLFGGEGALIEEVEADCRHLGVSVRIGIADTVGAAWALARFAGGTVDASRTGDDINQEARATRSRAAKRRHWVKGGAAPTVPRDAVRKMQIAPPGATRSALAPLPVAALRLESETVATLARLGLRHIGDLAGQPRAALARRFGRHLVQRLDQALGVEPEPVNPARPTTRFAVRLTLPEPIGLTEDIVAAIDRLLTPFGEKLLRAGRGARQIRMECHRSDHTMQVVDVGLARPSASADRIRPLLLMKLDDIDAGFGIDMIRLDARVSEPVHKDQHSGHVDAAEDGATRLGNGAAFDDLIGRMGARIGLESLTRFHPSDSHIPEKTASIVAAAWAEPTENWPRPSMMRPSEIWPPEIVMASDTPDLPHRFRWRGRDLELAVGLGPERIAPEWWLDEPDWRTGVRDYWRVTTRTGERLWLYFGYGGTMSPGWFCQGNFV
jgi:protein ImuB